MSSFSHLNHDRRFRHANMGDYSSCNQAAKDLVNKILVQNALAKGFDDKTDCIVTTDAEHNGTSSECRKEGFKGLITVPQIDRITASIQEQNWQSDHPEDRNHRVCGKHDICNDLPYFASHWTQGKNILLWNFDMCSTFYTYPVQSVETMCKIPQVIFSSSIGTLVAFTFAAIPHGKFCNQFKNCSSWKERLSLFDTMKSWKRENIMLHYLESMDELWSKNKLPCTRIEHVNVNMDHTQRKRDIYWSKHALLYEGNTRNESTMCLLLYRVWHDQHCHIKHEIPLIRVHQKRTIDELESENIMCDEKRIRTDLRDCESDFNQKRSLEENESEDEKNSINLARNKRRKSETAFDDSHLIDLDLFGNDNGNDGTDEVSDDSFLPDLDLFEDDGENGESDAFSIVSSDHSSLFDSTDFECSKSSIVSSDHSSLFDSTDFECSKSSIVSSDHQSLLLELELDNDGVGVYSTEGSEFSEFSDFESDGSEDTLVSNTDSEPSDSSNEIGDSGYSTTSLSRGNRQFEDLSHCDMFQHQLDMLRVMRDNDRGYINAICGSGKSLPMARSCLNERTSVIFVPYKVLVEQFYEKYFKCVPDITVHRVNSEYMTQVPRPNEGETTVYLSNYDSCHRLIELGIQFDLVHWDEAHLATSKRRRGKIQKMDGEPNETVDMEDVVSVHGKKHFFWTATPNRVMKTHPDIYGAEIYRYDFCTAVKDKIIKSFGIFISCNKGDHGEDDDEIKFKKNVQTTCDFIKNEKRKCVLVYVNRVAETNETRLTVDNLRKHRNLFPAEFRVEFISAGTKLTERNKIFDRFSRSDDTVHVLVSCRTISVGVDLPTCDAVVFADTNRNVTEIIQRGCRPLRLAAEEKITRQFDNAKIFFPIDVSATEVHTMMQLSQRDEEIHQAIRGSQFETTMLVLNLLKDSLEIEDYDFQRDETCDDKDDADLGNCNGKKATDESTNPDSVYDDERSCAPEKVQVHFNFPYSDYIWEESREDFAATSHNLCVSLKKQSPIEGWDDMTPLERNERVAQWSQENERRPSRKVKNASQEEKTMGSWWEHKLQQIKQGRYTGKEDDFAPLRKCDRWNQAVEELSRNKEGWVLQRNKDIAEWVTKNERRPLRKGKTHPRKKKRWGVGGNTSYNRSNKGGTPERRTTLLRCENATAGTKRWRSSAETKKGGFCNATKTSPNGSQKTSGVLERAKTHPRKKKRWGDGGITCCNRSNKGGTPERRTTLLRCENATAGTKRWRSSAETKKGVLCNATKTSPNG
jgi:superfamily II DNA or RNA helicase